MWRTIYVARGPCEAAAVKAQLQGAGFLVQVCDRLGGAATTWLELQVPAAEAGEAQAEIVLARLRRALPGCSRITGPLERPAAPPAGCVPPRRGRW